MDSLAQLRNKSRLLASDLVWKVTSFVYHFFSLSNILEVMSWALKTMLGSINYFFVLDVVKFSQRCDIVTFGAENYSEDLYNVCKVLDWLKNLSGIKYILGELNSIRVPSYIEEPITKLWKSFGELTAALIETVGKYVAYITESLLPTDTEFLPDLTDEVFMLAEMVRYTTDYITCKQICSLEAHSKQHKLLSATTIQNLVFHDVTARFVAFYQFNHASNKMLSSAGTNVVDGHYARVAKIITIGFAFSAVYHTYVEYKLEQALYKLDFIIGKCSEPESCTKEELFDSLSKYNHNGSPRSVFLGDTIVLPFLWNLNMMMHQGIKSGPYFDLAKTYYKNEFLPIVVGKLYGVVDSKREKVESILTAKLEYFEEGYWYCRNEEELMMPIDTIDSSANMFLAGVVN